MYHGLCVFLTSWDNRCNWYVDVEVFDVVWTGHGKHYRGDSPDMALVVSWLVNTNDDSNKQFFFSLNSLKDTLQQEIKTSLSKYQMWSVITMFSICH